MREYQSFVPPVLAALQSSVLRVGANMEGFAVLELAKAIG